MRRWPRESGLALTETCLPTTVTDGELAAGKALPIARARILINGTSHTTEMEPGSRAAVFTLHLEAGPTLLHTWFDDERRQPICGAYFVYVKSVTGTSTGRGSEA